MTTGAGRNCPARDSVRQGVSRRFLTCHASPQRQQATLEQPVETRIIAWMLRARPAHPTDPPTQSARRSAGATGGRGPEIGNQVQAGL